MEIFADVKYFKLEIFHLPFPRAFAINRVYYSFFSFMGRVLRYQVSSFFARTREEIYRFRIVLLIECHPRIYSFEDSHSLCNTCEVSQG